jgi:HSP20 family protein
MRSQLHQIYKELNLTHTPDCHIEELETSYKLSMDLAGVKKEDITIDTKDGVLTISGTRKGERGYNFEKKLKLGGQVTVDDAKAAFEDGVLTLVLPKAETVRTRKITIS